MLFIYLLSGIVLPFSFAAPSLDARQDDLSSFIAVEQPIALAGALANIGGLSSTWVEGASPGMVVASPSTVNPNYFYSWTRDSALTYAMIIDELILGNTSLRKTIEDYTHAQAVLQTIANPSGSLWPYGNGLGEPKFYTNITTFTGAWGRPQRDGPALRAIAFMNLAPVLFNLDETDTFLEIYWPLILNDLNYVGQYWNETGFDLWEEVQGSSFFTISVQHRALVQGALLSQQLNTTCAACDQAPQILCFLQNNFWNAADGFLIADINTDIDRSGINADPILASIHVFDADASCDAGDYQPCNSQMLATHKTLVDSFRKLNWPVNQNASTTDAILIGRYPEDVYFDGGAWPLCTLALAEMLYDAVAQINRTGTLNVNDINLGFFRGVSPDVAVGTYTGDAMSAILINVTTYADGFVSAVQAHLPTNGSISEQFDHNTGESTSASKLTWSFASFVTMARRRAGQFPPSWGAGSSQGTTNLTADQCQSSSYDATGQYLPAIAAGAPCLSEVLFTINATTTFGQEVYVVGNVTQLGGVLGDAASVVVHLDAANYTASRPEWFVDTMMPAGEVVAYQYVLLTGGEWVFDSQVRSVVVPGCGSGGVVTTNDAVDFS
ncbi:1, 4-alpha-D-glucan glucohydrolase [Exophiala viscosa]|uniref:Glucoamylase n=1 Tax=Exophiala viscosa TaxID=2486360 RepID=A0AAN6E2T1_9EURO|nr:1, 4-alpha-D-glucan glucohydrolase [Exophiala viscosa]KAI1630159.1 1, 4-alpha-D-glucan glucohydrolase [Exophiala viscosa]